MTSDVVFPVTVGDIVRMQNEPLHRVEYAIKSRGIRALRKIGNSRVYDELAYRKIAVALEEMRVRREATPALTREHEQQEAVVHA